MTYSALFKTVSDCIAVVAVTKRDSKGIATDFVVLDSTVHKDEAALSKEYFRAIGFDACLVDTYKNKSVSMVKMKDGEPTFEPLISPAESAEFFRSYYGIA